MSRMTLCLFLAGFISLSMASAADKPNGNRLTYLDEPCNPYYVHRDFPKLTTPMWVGEPGVEAVVILGIDDMRGHEKWEAYLRPILNRLKQIDGRAPVSIMTCTIDAKHPHLQQWLAEGLSLEIHTIDHPCPLLGGEIRAAKPPQLPLPPGEGGRWPGEGTTGQKTPEDKPKSSTADDKSKPESNAATSSPRPSPQGRVGQTTTLSPGLAKAKSTYDRCVDLLNEVPNNKPVCFRMPCCDSLNTLSPRFFTEIFAKTTEKGHFLQADSSVFHVFTSDDPALPRELVLEETPNDPKATNPNALAPSPLRGEGSSESAPATQTSASEKPSPLLGRDASRGSIQAPRSLTLSPAGRGDQTRTASVPAAAPAPKRAALRERFKKYIPADRFFANTIENYPYPYVIDRLCWEFPCVAPSDWSAQHLHKPHNPKTVEDWKAALDCTVIKQGVFCLVFHPHNWIKPEQINELIDHAVTKHGQKIKFLTFKESIERLNKNVLGGEALRDKRGFTNGVSLIDLDDDGFQDVVRRYEWEFDTALWDPKGKTWSRQAVGYAIREVLVGVGGRTIDRTIRFGLPAHDKYPTALWGSTPALNAFDLEGKVWNNSKKIELLGDRISGQDFIPIARQILPGGTVRFRDLDDDGSAEVILTRGSLHLLMRWSNATSEWEKLAIELPQGSMLIDVTGKDAGLRFIDIDEDGHDDIVFSNHERYGIWLWESMKTGWSREVLSGQRGDKPAEQELPPIVRADGSNNGFWVHSRQFVWMNEDTAKAKDLVERRTFDQLLASSRRLVTPSRPDGAATPEDKKSPNEKKKEGKTAEGGRPTESERDEAPKSPEESLKLMQVKPGYRVELVAAEPLVRDPVAFDWGPDGKLWVAEMADYPLGVGQGEEADGADASLHSSPHAPREEPKRDTTPKAENAPSSAERSARHAERDGYKKGGGRVRFLKDTDGDGKYDKSTVFLDKLNFPNGVMAWRDGVLISAAPDVLFARDTNGDGKADEVKILLTGFGEGNQQHRVNGFSWGLDNMVHCANGDSGGSIKVVAALRDAKSKSRSDLATVDIRGRDFGWNPDTGEIDPTTGQTQFGRNRDDFGNWFGNNNANPMYHFVLDDYYIRRNPHVAPPDPRKQVSINPGPSPVFPISRTLARFNDLAMANRFTSANSAMVYRDELLFERSRHAPRDEPSKSDSRTQPNAPTSSNDKARHAERDGYVAHVFISEPVHNLVHHEIMTAEGVTFTSRRPDDEQQSEFLASRDNWFRPTQIKTGPDGALYIADMYRQVIEHPQYIPPAMQEKLDLRAGHDKGRIYRILPSDGFVNFPSWPLESITDQTLVASLNESSGTVRDLAHRMLLWRCRDHRQEELLAVLARVILQKEALPATREGGTTFSSVSASPQARIHALSLLDGLHAVSTVILSASLQDPHPAVRRRALQAVEKLDGELPPLLFTQLAEMGRDADPFVRIQVAYTLGHPKFASLGNELGKLLYRERDDKYLVAAAMSSVHAKNVASVVANVFESVALEPNASRGATSPTLPPQLASTLLGLASALGNDQALLSLIESVLSGAATSESQPVVLAQMLESLDRRGTSLSQLKNVNRQQLARAEQQLAECIAAARMQIGDFKSQISNPAPSIENQKSKIENQTIAALPLLGREPPRRAEDAQLIGTLLVPQTPVPVQTAAVTTLARINHDDSAAALLSGWRTFTPSLRTQVLDALLSRAAWTDKLLDEIAAKAISPSDIDAAQRQRLIAHSNEAVRTRAAKLLEVSANADRQMIVAEIAAKLRELNTPGDAANGAEVFKKRCATCHKLKGVGTSVGSDLMLLTDKSRAALLTAILDPNKAVEAKFLAYTAVSKQGQVFSGLIAAETGNSIMLTATDGKQHTLLRADLDEFVSSNKSFMPEGLEKDVSPSELADVIAFVQSSGPSPKKFEGNTPDVVQPSADGSLRLAATNAEIHGKTLVFEPQFQNLGYWGSVDDRAVWTINIPKPGKYNLRLNYACDNNTAGNELVITVADQRLIYKVTGTGSWENYQTFILGDLNLSAGEQRLAAQAAESLKNHLLDWKELRLIPSP